jgi:S-adenosylmethionine/arginine decarboxylase-like enzyme
MKDLVDSIGMELEAGPITAYNRDTGYRGITTTCLIRTSHIAMHVWDEMNPAMIQLDVYSCQDFELKDVVDMLDLFKPYSVQWMKLDRESGLMHIGSGHL